MNVLELENLTVSFAGRGGLLSRTAGTVRAVDGVSLEVREREVVALVGESGCGKTTLARTVLGLVAPSSGVVRLLGERIKLPPPRRIRRKYYERVQMVFQDSLESLNPRKTASQALEQPLAVHRVVPRSSRRREIDRLLEIVGLSPAARFAGRYPHQMSGGQRQRLGIARALAVRPRLLVADECVSALDVSVRAQILRLLQDLRTDRDLAYLFITHDLTVVRSLADRVLIMYFGQLVEEGSVAAVLGAPRHPYTVALLDSLPRLDRNAAPRVRLAGDPPPPTEPPTGCRFHTRCPMARDICKEKEPVWVHIEGGHRSKCHFATSVKPTRIQESDRGRFAGGQP